MKKAIPISKVQSIIKYELLNEQNHGISRREQFAENGMKIIGFDIDSWANGEKYKF